MQEQNKEIKWNLATIWNNVAMKEDRPPKARDYVFASEIGGAFADRWLKMKGSVPTNPPNNRSLRKFLMGNLLEHVTRSIFIACGIFRKEEVKVDATPYADCLSVHGRLDFICGGLIDPDEAMKHLFFLQLPYYLQVIGEKIIKELAGKVLQERIIELKSVSTFAFEKVTKTEEAIAGHTMQAYHYQKNAAILASICYCCRDDARLAQFDVCPDASEPLYRADLLQMTEYYKSKKMPPIESPVVFDEILGKFSRNFKVEYSSFLTKLYGFVTPEEFRDSVKYVDSWNRTLNRYYLVETGAKTPGGKSIDLTPKNKETGKEIEKVTGKKMDDILHLKMLSGVMAEDAAEVEG